MAEIGLFAESKDPAGVLDYQFDWTGRLEPGEALTDYTLRLDGSAILGTHSRNGALITFWVSGGLSGTISTATCTVTTSAGRTFERSRRIAVEQR